MAMYNNIWQCIIIYGNIQQYIAIYNNVRQCTIIYGNVRQCMAMLDNVLQCTAMYGNVWQCIAICLHPKYNLGQSGTVTTYTVTAKKERRRSAYMDVRTV